MSAHRPVESIERALSRQDGSFLFPLTLMSADEILEARSGSDTVLSLLVSALFIPAEGKNQMFFGEIYRALVDLCSSVLSRVARLSVLDNVLKKSWYAGSLPAGSNDGNRTKEAEYPSCVPRNLVFAVADGIGVVANKIEEARMAAVKSGPKAYSSHRMRVSTYIQNENVTYALGRVEFQKSSVEALVLQYLLCARDPERQLEVFEPLKRFLLGFSDYRLDARGAHSVHYALSLCGGTHEDRFLAEVLRPLLLCAQERFSELGPDKGLMQDDDKNTLIHYAVASVYGSGKAIDEVLQRFGGAGLPEFCDGRLSIVEMFINNIPYYALFFSVEDHSRGSMKGLAESTRVLRSALCCGDVSLIRRATADRVSALRKVHAPALALRSDFTRTLSSLCCIDEKLRDVGVRHRSEASMRFAVPEMLLGYRESMRRICDSSDMVSNARDWALQQHVQKVFDDCDKRCTPLGARIVAPMVARAVLSDPAYIRRLGITAACSANGEKSAEADLGADDLASGWSYDRYSRAVNGFLGSVSDLCKSGADTWNSLYQLRSSTVHAIAVCERDRTCYSLAAKCAAILICVVMPVSLVLWNAYFILQKSSSTMPSVLTTSVVNVAFVVVTALAFIAFHTFSEAVQDTDMTIDDLRINYNKCVQHFCRTMQDVNTFLDRGNFPQARSGSESGQSSSGDTVHESMRDTTTTALIDDVSLNVFGVHAGSRRQA